MGAVCICRQRFSPGRRVWDYRKEIFDFENLPTFVTVVVGAVIGQVLLDRFRVIFQTLFIVLAIGVGVSAVLGIVLSSLLKTELSRIGLDYLLGVRADQ